MVTCSPAAAPSGFNWGLAGVACMSKRWTIAGYGESQLRRADGKKMRLGFGSNKVQPQTPGPVWKLTPDPTLALPVMMRNGAGKGGWE